MNILEREETPLRQTRLYIDIPPYLWRLDHTNIQHILAAFLLVCWHACRVETCWEASTCYLGECSSDASHVVASPGFRVMGVADRLFLFLPREFHASVAEVFCGPKYCCSTGAP